MSYLGKPLHVDVYVPADAVVSVHGTRVTLRAGERPDTATVTLAMRPGLALRLAAKIVCAAIHAKFQMNNGKVER